MRLRNLFVFFIICSCSDSQLYYGKSEAGPKSESYESDDDEIDVFSVGNGRSESDIDPDSSVFRLRLAGIYHENDLSIESWLDVSGPLSVHHVKENMYEIHYSGDRLDALISTRSGKGVRVLANADTNHSARVYELSHLYAIRFNFLADSGWKEGRNVSVYLKNQLFGTRVIKDGTFMLSQMPGGLYQFKLTTESLVFSQSILVSETDVTIDVSSDYELREKPDSDSKPQDDLTDKVTERAKEDQIPDQSDVPSAESPEKTETRTPEHEEKGRHNEKDSGGRDHHENKGSDQRK